MTVANSKVQRCTAFRTASWIIRSGHPGRRCRAWAVSGTYRCISHPKKEKAS